MLLTLGMTRSRDDGRAGRVFVLDCADDERSLVAFYARYMGQKRNSGWRQFEKYKLQLRTLFDLGSIGIPQFLRRD
eukprot:scaffold10128_cov42-Attheya_sp.AAC.2